MFKKNNKLIMLVRTLIKQRSCLHCIMCRSVIQQTQHLQNRKTSTESNSRNNNQHDHIPHSTYIHSITKSHVLNTLNEVENSMIRKYLRGYSRFQTRLIFAILASVGLGCFSLYMFREPIKDNLSDEVADVATRSLSDESVVLKANEITRIVLKDLINDPTSHVIVSQFVMDILQNENVKNSVIQLTKYVIENEETQKQVNRLIIHALNNLLQDETMFNVIKGYIKQLLAEPEINQSCQLLIKGLAEDSYTQELLVVLLKNVVASEKVTNQAIVLGKQVTDNVLSDHKIQKETGNALWNAGWYSVTPSWFLK